MDSSLLLSIVAAAIVLFTLLKKIRFLQGDKEKDSSSSPRSPSSSLTPSSVPPSPRIWTHHVFPSFRGEDVRRDFLSHIQMEFERMGITPFIDNEIKRGESIGPELVGAIRGSTIAIILLSQNYASSKWCLDELVEIMKCKEEFGQTVMAIFYRVDPSDVKNLTGNIGKVFRKTCAGKTKEDIRRWKQALEKVATIAGYHSSNWDNEAAMIKKIAADISNKLNNCVSSSDFDGLVGMRAHLEKIKPLLCLDSSEVRMIGIWGPPGIGKTTIARVAYNQLSNSFQLSVFMENIKANYTRPCSDDYQAKLQLQQQLMSQITNHKDMEVSHLGVAQDRLKDKKVLVVLDGVDQLAQLHAMAKEILWFGPGSRIIITTQDRKLFRAHGVKHIYKVDFPSIDESLQIFCMHAFGQKSPKEGFEKVSWKVIELVGNLPLGLRVMGSYFRGMSKQEWKKSLPRLRTTLDADIQSILKFSYDALDDEDKDLFLHIACFFNNAWIKKVEEYLAEKFLEVGQRLNVLAEKSLISINSGYVDMHSFLERLGREIVRKQSIHEPGQRQFLVDGREICEVLTSDAAGSKNVRGVKFNHIGKELVISERAFQGMSNLQFLRFNCNHDALQLPRGLNYLSAKLQILDWSYFPLTCLPSTVNLEFLVELYMTNSKLEKLWEGVKPIRSLKRMNLCYSKNLKELPDFSTATNLQKLDLRNCCTLVKLPSSIRYANNLDELYLGDCSSLVKPPFAIGYINNLYKLDLRNCSSLINLPSSIGNAISLKRLYLFGCSSLVELPSTIGNATSLQELDLTDCARLLEIPSSLGNAANLEELVFCGCSSLMDIPHSIGNLQKLQRLMLKGCPKLEILPTNIDLKSLDELDLTDCSTLYMFPEISTNVKILKLRGTAIEEVPPSIMSWPRLDHLHMSYFEKLKEYPHALDIITWLDISNTDIQEVPLWVKKFSCLCTLELKECSKLVSIPQIPDSLLYLYAEGCESLERLDFSYYNPGINLYFVKCFKLNQENSYTVLPGGEVPSHFTHLANTGGLLTIKLDERPLPTFMTFKACILFVGKGPAVADHPFTVRCRKSRSVIHPVLTEHLYIFEVEVEVTSSELVFEFKVNRKDWKIGECGLRQLS